MGKLIDDNLAQTFLHSPPLAIALSWVSFLTTSQLEGNTENKTEKDSCYCYLFFTRQAISLILYTVKTFNPV